MRIRGDAKSVRKMVALRYRREDGAAPRLTAKAEGSAAERLLRVAREAGVAIKEDAQLLSLLAPLEISQEIPEALYRVVALLLAEIYNAASQSDGAPRADAP